jgi:anaerobic magnesium-protoporphyrin IX monomethyl ester cyclase
VVVAAGILNDVWRSLLPSPRDPAPAAGYRRVLLVNPPQESIGAEFMMEDVPLRLEYLAAYIRPHVARVEILDLSTERRSLARVLRSFRPDLVGISVNYISTHKTGLDLARQARAAGAAVVVGGYQATAMEEEFAAHPDVDFVVRGEGEATLLDLVQGRPLAEVQGLTYRRSGVVVRNEDRPLIADLDSLPFPERRRRVRKYKLPFADLESDVATAYDMIITSRGCWGRCTFCTEPIMSRGTQRYRKPEKVIEELEEILALHRGKRLRVHIADPNFGGNPRIAEALCDRLIELRRRSDVDLHFFVSVRTSTVANNPRLTQKMIDAGIDYVFVGMESPRAEDLKVVSKGAESREKQERAAARLREGGVAIMSCFLLGLPSQSEDDMLALVEYAKGLGLADCYFSVMTPFPGSHLFAEALAKDQLVERDPTRFKLWDMVLKHDSLTRAKVREMCVRCNAKWYDDLMLVQEHVRFLRNGRRPRKLYDFAGKFQVLVGFFAFMGADPEGSFQDLDPALFVKDMPNPALRDFTSRHGVHTFLEMRRFLRLLGDQELQVTLHSNHQPVVSWAAKTTATTVEYLDAVAGAPTRRGTLVVNVDLDDRDLSAAKLLRRVLADNRDGRARLALLRLAAAATSEVGAMHLDRAVETVRYRLQQAAGGGASALGESGRVGSVLARLRDRLGGPRRAPTLRVVVGEGAAPRSDRAPAVPPAPPVPPVSGPLAATVPGGG